MKNRQNRLCKDAVQDILQLQSEEWESEDCQETGSGHLGMEELPAHSKRDEGIYTRADTANKSERQ